jgi:hypothetical protein
MIRSRRVRRASGSHRRVDRRRPKTARAALLPNTRGLGRGGACGREATPHHPSRSGSSVFEGQHSGGAPGAGEEDQSVAAASRLLLLCRQWIPEPPSSVEEGLCVGGGARWVGGKFCAAALTTTTRWLDGGLGVCVAAAAVRCHLLRSSSALPSLPGYSETRWDSVVRMAQRFEVGST